MKQLLLISLFCGFFLFPIKNAISQQSQTIVDVFLALPDTAFTTIKELNFAEKDSFSVKERTKMIANYDQQKKTFTPEDPRFHIISENETNHLLYSTNNEVNMNVKFWSITDNESLIAVDGSYKDDWNYQTIKFYKYKSGKITPVQALPEDYPISLFFDSTYLENRKVDPNYTIPHPFIEFSKTGDDLEVKVQPEIFKEEIVGAAGHPLTRLRIARIKRPWVLLKLQGDKFVIVK